MTMMVLRRILLGIWLVSLLLSSYSHALMAQTTAGVPQITVLRHVVAEDQIALLKVRVPFQLRDAEGRSISDTRSTSLKLRLLDMPPGAIV